MITKGKPGFPDQLAGGIKNINGSFDLRDGKFGTVVRDPETNDVFGSKCLCLLYGGLWIGSEFFKISSYAHHLQIVLRQQFFVFLPGQAISASTFYFPDIPALYFGQSS